MVKSAIISTIIALSVGCNFTSIPSDIQKWHTIAQVESAKIQEIAQPGDIVFRLSNTYLLGGLLNFSKEVAKATNSDFSHACFVYEVRESGIIIVDVTPDGLTRRFLIDWYLDPSTNVVITRLKPEYRYLLPAVINELDKLVKEDNLYDAKFIPDDDLFYCTEIVDHCFRTIGHPLAERIKIKDFPKSKILFFLGCSIAGIDINEEVSIAGNEQHGLFSSDMLEIILDLR